jgi:alpha-galactosidase
MLDQHTLTKMVSCVRLSDESIATDKEIYVERGWEGSILNSKVVNRSKNALKIKEVVLFCGELPVKPETAFYGGGYQMLCQYAGTLEAPHLIGAYGTDWDFFRIPKTSLII